MSIINDISAASTSMPLDLAKRIGIRGINEILNIFWSAYYEMKNDKKVEISETSEEDDITSYLYEKLIFLWNSKNRATSIINNAVYPKHQHGDNTLKKGKGVKSPTIDVCFKDWNSTSYFGAECKNLYRNNKSKTERYVKTGIENYTSGRYGSESSKNSIIGYLLSGTIPDVVTEINLKIKQSDPKGVLHREKGLEPQYISNHKRTFDNKSIELYHLFYDFSQKETI